MVTLGIDVGGSWIKTARVEDDAVRIEERHPTASSYPALVEQLAGLASARPDGRGIAAVGVGVAGFIDFAAGEIVKSPNLPWLDHTRLGDDLRARLGVPLVLDNDANAAALGEYVAMPAPRPGSLVHLTLGTGIGSGIVLDGRLWRGERGFAAELGHVTVEAAGRPCRCGGRGCAETEASASGIAWSYREYSGRADAVTAEQVFARLQAGDPFADQAFSRAGRALGVLLATIVHFLNPAVVTIGGGAAAAGESILAPARDEFRSRVPAECFAATRLEPARLGNRAGAIGAARLARAEASGGAPA